MPIIKDMLLRQSHRGSRRCFNNIFYRVRDGRSNVFSRSASATRLGHRIHFSSEAAYLSKVPDYLIPPAYRTRSPNDDKDGGRGRGRGGNTERHGSRSGSAKLRSRSGGRHNHNGSKQARKQSKHRRKPSSGNRRSLNRTKRDASIKNLDVQQLERELTTKINVYNEMLGEISFQNFGAYADKNAKEEEATQISSSKGTFFTSDDSGTSNNVNVADLLATEDLYKDIASDLHKLIMGFTDIAETACNAQIAQSRDRNDEEEVTESDTSAAMLSHYLDSIMKAERYLEALETLYRNRIGAISKAKATLERQKLVNEQNDTKVLGKLSSFLGDVFLLNNSSKHSAFDESWKRADGKMVPPSINNSQKHVEVTLDNIDNVVVSHQNVEFTPKTTLYVEQLILANQLAYCFGMDEKTKSVQRSNRLLNRWISVNCLTQAQETSRDTAIPSSTGKDDTEESSVVRELFHNVMRQNSDLWSIEGVKQAEEWITQMHSLQQSGWIHCAPDVDAYNIVLLGLCNLCKPLSPKHPDNENRISKREERSRRKFILERAEALLTQLTELHDDGIHPNILSLNLSLNALAKAGKDGDPTLCKTTNRVLLKTIGEEHYRSIVDINCAQPCDDEPIGDTAGEPDVQGTTKSFVKPNMDTYHWLVDIYSRSGDTMYIKLGTTLLKKMIEHRLEEQSGHRFREGSTSSFAPSTGTYNNILRALAKKDIDISFPKDKSSIEMRSEVAKEATAFLDSMIRYETSYPTRVTFIFLLQLWRKTGSTEAGEYADEILSRMETVSTYQRDLKPFSNGYLLALECWYTAATAGYVGAAERAFKLVQIVEGKSGQDLISDDHEEDDTESASPNKRIYPLMMKICAATKEKKDTPRSMAIAFDVLKKMEDNDMKPGHTIFSYLYESVQNFLKHHPGEEGNDLLQEVFVSARKYGVKAPELKNRAGRNRD
ncbi:hypothetical protein ACHAWT_003405 [Skeletonema menzelii]